jgi:tetratricopeptide (TPR) repeat protein
MLEQQRSVVIVGQGGEGKTTLACELGRWLVQTGRFRRAGFVSFEQATTAEVALSLLGDQLVPDYQSKAGQGDNRGWQEVERALREQASVLVLDNLESVLKSPAASQGAEAFEPEALEEILTLCRDLQQVGKTHLVLTSREELPEPFTQNTIPLGPLSKADALDLVAKTLGEGRWLPEAGSEEENEAAIEELVEAAGYHARALVLLTGEIRRSGVKDATAHFARLMRQMEQEHPRDRERSLLASVQLSLERLPEETRQRIRPLGVFQGGASLTAINAALQIEEDETLYAIGAQLLGVGLAEEQEYGYLRFDPALPVALLSELSLEEQAAACDRWARTMQGLAEFLYWQLFSDPQLALGLAQREMPNLLAALEYRAGTAEVEEVVEFATRVEHLAQKLGRVRTVAQVVRLREAAAKKLGDWSHAAFQAESAAIDRLLDGGRFGEAVAAAERLLERCEQAGEAADSDAAYDLAIAHFTLGRALKNGGASGAALASLVEAERLFTALAESGDRDATRMASAARTERADCLRNLGRLDEAAALYEQTIQDAEQHGNPRSAAVGRGQLGTVRMLQGRYGDALQAYEEARETFERLGEPQSLAAIWHQTGMVYRRAGDYPTAERAYQESLQLMRLLGDRTGLADCLNELGTLYQRMNRDEEAVRFFGEAATIYIKLRDGAREGKVRNNAAISLIQLQSYDEARRELERAIVCDAPFGHAAEPWKTYANLHDLETAVGNEAAARAAREQAMQAYLAYRREGGASQDSGGQVAAAVAQALAAGQTGPVAVQLAASRNDPNMPDYRQPMLRALQRFVSGERDLALTDDPDLFYMDAVELRLLLEGTPDSSPAL